MQLNEKVFEMKPLCSAFSRLCFSPPPGGGCLSFTAYKLGVCCVSPLQVFSLLIVAIGVYAKIQKATGKTHPPTCSLIASSLQGPSFYASPFVFARHTLCDITKGVVAYLVILSLLYQVQYWCGFQMCRKKEKNTAANVNADYTAVSHVGLLHRCPGEIIGDL